MTEKGVRDIALNFQKGFFKIYTSIRKAKPQNNKNFNNSFPFVILFSFYWDVECKL